MKTELIGKSYSYFDKMSSLRGKDISFEDFKKEILEDYRISQVSRQLSKLGRKEVLTGKAKFGIFGDGKEIAQVAMAKNFRNGDWRSGYYRDQTFMLAADLFTPEEFFAQLYGDTDVDRNPGNAGRSFNNHFATRSLNPDGSWKNLSQMKNSAADLSPTAGQMPRLVGLAYASKLFRHNQFLHAYTNLSDHGNEVAFGMIGDASTSEGHFFETMNAAGVMQIPMVVAVWDDGYGISVPVEEQTVKSDISVALKGFERDSQGDGILIYKARGWDYPGLCLMFHEGIQKARDEHVPVLFHVTEMVQPLGHSTSGSHERYKSKERLEWEKAHDPLLKTREWILAKGIATENELDSLEETARVRAKEAREKAWSDFMSPIKKEREKLLEIVQNRNCVCKREGYDKIDQIASDLKKITAPVRRDVFSSAKRILRHVCLDCTQRKQLQQDLTQWLQVNYERAYEKYSVMLYNESKRSALKVKITNPFFFDDSPLINGREVLRDNFDVLFDKYPLLLTFGEDTGKLGDVNQALEGLQQKFGSWRVSDTGIRETTIIGQGIGLALRGLRPIAEIQYFDYILYGLQTLSDDLATYHWRTKGGQAVPLIIRTRGHRLEGIWHSGSPLSMVINSIRGVYVCVPRNMTQAAGFYNLLLQADDPALVVEPLNGYRLKERRPGNLGEFTVPLGIPEILNEGDDVTLVTYGSCVRIAQDAVRQLEEFQISVELIDVQTLLPFDINHVIVESIKKTNRIIFFDEDVPGGATAFMMKQVIEDQQGYFWLDSEPRTITAKDHRPAYTSDGDYFSNPNAEDVFEIVYEMMHEAKPEKYPRLY